MNHLQSFDVCDRDFEIAKSEYHRNHLRDVRHLEEERERLRVAIKQRVRAEVQLSKLSQSKPMQLAGCSKVRLQNAREVSLRQGSFIRKDGKKE